MNFHYSTVERFDTIKNLSVTFYAKLILDSYIVKAVFVLYCAIWSSVVTQR